MILRPGPLKIMCLSKSLQFEILVLITVVSLLRRPLLKARIVLSHRQYLLMGLPWWFSGWPSNSGDSGLIPGQGTKIPCAGGQLRPLAAVRSPCAPAKILQAATKARHSQIGK